MTKGRILVAASMGGGASAVAPVIHRLRERGASVAVWAYGAGVSAFRSRGMEPDRIVSGISLGANALDLLAFKPDAILTGTQVQDSQHPLLILEHSMWSLGMAHRIKTAAVLDIADNVLARFSDLKPGAPDLAILNLLSHMPDLVAVPDVYTRDQMIGLGFRESALAVTGNPGFEYVAHDAAKLAPATRAELLAKPVFADFFPDGKLIVFLSDSWDGFNIGFTEKSVLQSFLLVANRLAAELGLQINVIVRSHPFRNKDAADAFAVDTPHIRKVLHNPITARGSEPANEYTMAQLLHAADVVVGTFNNALIEAAIIRAVAMHIEQVIINWVPGITPEYEMPPGDYQRYLWGRGISTKLKHEEYLFYLIRDTLTGSVRQTEMDLQQIQGATDRVVALLE